MSIYTNNYIPEFVPQNRFWFERDELMTCYDQMCENFFLRDTNKYFKETKIIKFDITHRGACGEKVPKELLKHYQTVLEQRILQYSKSDQNKILSSAFRKNRSDLFFEKNVFNHFKK